MSEEKEPVVMCARCKVNPGQQIFQPIQTYEEHIEITFIEHLGCEAHEVKRVPMCRKCAIIIARAHLEKADDERLTFWV